MGGEQRQKRLLMDGNGGQKANRWLHQTCSMVATFNNTINAGSVIHCNNAGAPTYVKIWWNIVYSIKSANAHNHKSGSMHSLLGEQHT